jgi:AcrR family transcriptional regulator
VAALAGVDSALIGSQFGSKAKLWEAVVDQLSDEQQVHLAEISALRAELSGDGEAALSELVRLLVTISIEMPQFPALLAQIASESGVRFEEFRIRIVEPFLDACEPIIAHAHGSGLIHSVEPRLFLGMLLSAISLPLLSPSLFLPGYAPAQIQDQLHRQAQWFVGLS